MSEVQHRSKSRCWQSCVSFCRLLEGNLFSCFFQLLNTAICVLWLMDLFPASKPVTPLPAQPSSCGHTYDHKATGKGLQFGGAVWLDYALPSQLIQKASHLRALNLITSATLLYPMWHIHRLWGLGSGCLGDHYLACHKSLEDRSSLFPQLPLWGLAYEKL